MTKSADWYQQSLTPPEVVEVRIRLGLITETDHAQCLVEIFDPITGVQIGQASIPHDRVQNWPIMLDWARSRADEWIRETVDPF
jgi:hypothetical protein